MTKLFRKRHRNQKGFTLVEIMAVTGIISMLMAMTMPNFLRSRIGANESAAQMNLKQFNQVLEDFRFTYGRYPQHKGLLDWFSKSAYGGNAIIENTAIGGERVTIGNPNFSAWGTVYYLFQGYRYDYWVSGTRLQYQMGAMPDRPGISGNRYFITSESGTLNEVDASYAESLWPTTTPQSDGDENNDGDDGCASPPCVFF